MVVSALAVQGSSMDWLRLPFDPSGRIGRRAYGLAMLGVYAVWWGTPFALVLPAVIARNSQLGPPDSLLPLLFLLQFVVLPYVGVCLHLKRLRDAGRGPWSLVVMVALTLTAFPAAIAFGLWSLRGQSSVENLNYPIVIGILLILTAIVIVLAWPAYAFWVGLGASRIRPAQDNRQLATAFE